ncbi:MAG: hypothetical protein ACOZNI_09160 [Myxococcota bacterium]
MLLLFACAGRDVPARVEPSFVEVELGDVETGTAEAPLPFSTEPVDVPVTVRTLDVNGEPWDFDGDLVVHVRPGRYDGDPWITIADGEWSGTVAIYSGFGATRIWFADEGDKDADSGRATSWATGVSEPFHFAWPTLAEAQTTDDTETSPLEGEYGRFRAEDRQIVVTARDTAGLWVTDVADAPGSFNSMYVYTFSRPDDALYEGARVTLLAGIDQEYLASTQLSWPTVETDGTELPVPDAVALDGCEDLVMEGLEASRVVVFEGTVPETFVEGSEEYTDFELYGQWPLEAGGCTVYVESGTSAPDFWAPDHAGETLPEVSGMLKQVFDKWILVVVDGEDILTTDGR